MDYKTLFTLLVRVFLIQTVALAQTWRQNPEEIGIRDGSVDTVWMSFLSLYSVVGLYMHARGADARSSDRHHEPARPLCGQCAPAGGIAAQPGYVDRVPVGYRSLPNGATTAMAMPPVIRSCGSLRNLPGRSCGKGICLPIIAAMGRRPFIMKTAEISRLP